MELQSSDYYAERAKELDYQLAKLPKNGKKDQRQVLKQRIRENHELFNKAMEREMMGRE